MLGVGGFATVYLADDPRLDAHVAVKVLGEPAAHDPDLRRRFIDEGRLLRRTTDERVLRVHDLGEVDGRPYLVLDLHESGTLADRLDAIGPRATVGDDEIRHVVEELAAVLRAVHAAGVVHRDLTPSNLLIAGSTGDDAILSSSERLVVADFGLARRLDASDVTVGGGTADFMAPEQRGPSSEVDRRADVYAATRIVERILTRSAESELHERLRPALDAGSADVPADRPPDAASWATNITSALSDASPPVLAPARRMTRTHRRAVAIGLVALVAAAVVVALLLGGGGGDEPGDRPQIIGPDELLLGDPGTWTHENRPGVEYEWTLPSGERSDDIEVRFTPTEPVEFVIALSEVDQGVERRSELVVRVRTR